MLDHDTVYFILGTISILFAIIPFAYQNLGDQSLNRNWSLSMFFHGIGYLSIVMSSGQVGWFVILGNAGVCLSFYFTWLTITHLSGKRRHQVEIFTAIGLLILVSVFLIKEHHSRQLVLNVTFVVFAFDLLYHAHHAWLSTKLRSIVVFKFGMYSLLGMLVLRIIHLQTGGLLINEGLLKFDMLWYSIVLQIMMTLLLGIARITTLLDMALQEKTYQANHDELTDVMKRKYFKTVIEQEVISVDEDYVIGVVDIDDFKSVNDQYGHEIGDKTLCKVASCIKENIQDYGYVCRYGGDEFVLCIKGSVFLAETIRKNIIRDAANIKVGLEDSDNYVGISLGLSGLSNKRTYNELFKEADSAMYGLKRDSKVQESIEVQI